MKRSALLLAIMASVLWLSYPEPLAAATVASGPPNAQNQFPWTGTIQPDANQSGCNAITVVVLVDVNTGIVNIGTATPFAPGTTTQSGSCSATYHSGGGTTTRSQAGTTSGAATGVTINESAGSAGGVSASIVTASGLNGAGTPSGEFSSDGSYTLHFDIGQCDYTITIAVHYPNPSGGSVQVTISDGS